MADIKVGKVTHYYDKIGVAVVDLEGKLAVGDNIKIVDHGNEFIQGVSSIQFDHKTLDHGGLGQSVGLKVDQRVREGAELFKINS